MNLQCKSGEGKQKGEERDGEMREIPVKVRLPELIYQMAVKAVLLYRRMRYGEVFRKIPLTKGLCAIVSPEDYDRLSKFKWHAARHGRSIYTQHGTGSAKSGKRRGYLVMMHRGVMGVEDGRLVDHRNHNGLDNRRSNLRIATWEENCWNKRKPIAESSSKYKGVMRDKRL